MSVFRLSVLFNILLSVLFLTGFVGPNFKTSFNPEVDTPVIAKSARVHTLAAVVGSVRLGKHVYVAPFASIRGDEGQDLYIGDDSNVQDSVVIHGLETYEKGHEIVENEVEANGKKYSVYIGSVSRSRINRRFTVPLKSETTALSACKPSCSRPSLGTMSSWNQEQKSSE